MRAFGAVRAALAGAAVAALAGCGSGGQSTTSPGLPDVTFEQVVRIGSVDDPAASLNDVRGLAVTSGRLFVLEGSPPRVVVFTPAGERVGEFGGPGDGPGEFRWPTALGVKGDTVWVADERGGRLELFTLDGEVIESVRFRVPADSLGAVALPRAPLPDGTFLAGPGGLDVGAVASGRLTHVTYYRTDRNGQVLDTIVTHALAPGDFFMEEVEGGQFIMGGHPIAESPLVVVFPDGAHLAVAERWIGRPGDSTTFSLRVLGGTGGIETETVVPYVPRATGDWLNRFIAGLEPESGEVAPEARRTYQALRKALGARRTFAPVSSLVPGGDGSLWVKREDDLMGPVTWLIVGPDGEPLATTRFANDVRLLAVARDEAWGVVTDDHDVPYVVRYRVRSSSGP